MNKTSLYAKGLFILLAIGFAVGSAIPSRAADDRDVKKTVNEIRDAKWTGDGKKGRCQISVDKIKSDGDWDMIVAGLTPATEGQVTLEECNAIGGQEHCVGQVEEIPHKKGNQKDCKINRLIYAKHDGVQHARLVAETVMLTNVKETESKFLVFGRKLRSCLAAYYQRDGKEDSVLDGGSRSCEEKK